MKQYVKLFFLNRLGREIRDADSGLCLGRALVFFWGGRLILLGYQGPPLRVSFMGETPFSYTRRVVCFRAAEVPDYPRIGRK